jgi:hypothetical protein
MVMHYKGRRHDRQIDPNKVKIEIQHAGQICRRRSNLGPPGQILETG